MAFIEIVRSNGTSYTTTEKIGSKAEKNYFTVMTERWGKLFFTSKKHYQCWTTEGRKQNDKNGCIMNAEYYFENSQEGGENDLMIVEAYQVNEDILHNDDE